ncbi:hypothetical protein IMG5_147630 [Ichthyophthirius multifiliis]|uniref:Uncharacterized protein n=1 Tax=Ichthyophthirius multifiliis TaxID=5932 RepID=G0QY60_ICHMU|nr:hypothetical protein IMG5_147630 [Ichthyophthirius multifiliis]EGR29834.1 hypothetical protein IMG5_147630 [Ichthyophthirius multifiliis]|eukprot:XP_004031070.1 hypothetical protein IMG5_147630 [Ichthyophthirius multifiliis]
MNIKQKSFQKNTNSRQFIIVAFTPEQAKLAALEIQKLKPQTTGISFRDFQIKAQIHAGGRDKGFFKEHPQQSGVQVVFSPEEAEELASKMIGSTLITSQTGFRGRYTSAVLVSERLFLRKELFMSISLNAEKGGINIICNDKGFISTDERQNKTTKQHFVTLQDGINKEKMQQIIESFNLDKTYNEQLKNIVGQLFQCFLQNDATYLEVKPLGLTIDGQLIICDQKIQIDDNSAFRQIELASIEDIRQKDEKEIIAQKNFLNYIALDGNIGSMVNGAGLAMTTMDLIAQRNGSPANFLDCGGTADSQQIIAALKILANDKNIESIFINIHAGITSCDIIAMAIIKALSEVGIKKPIVLRLKGKNFEQAKQIIYDCGFNILVTEDLIEATDKVIKTAQILRMAREAKININLLS